MTKFFTVLAVMATILLPATINSLPKHSNDQVCTSEPLVELKNGGRVRGLCKTGLNGRELHTYLSIRYARANRFAHSVAEGPWDEVYEATHQREACPQEDPTVKHSEDCLYLNVIQPIDSGDKLKPVMVWIYGGGFNLGSIHGVASIIYDGSVIASLGDVVYVNMNYRLGPFGFLYSGTDEAPGNQGVHDVIMALRWVQDNIEKFGGDPNRVTIFGESAGSFMSSMLILSPMAKGLFQRAIMQSGAVSDLKNLSPEYSLEKTREFARKCGCNQDDADEMVECLKRMPRAKLTLHAGGLNFIAMFTGRQLVIMRNDKAGILPDLPSKIIRKGQYNPVDLMFGFVHDEVAEILVLLDLELLNPLKLYTRHHLKKKLYPIIRKFTLDGHEEELFKYYFKDEHRALIKSDTVRRKMTDMFSDPVMNCPTYLFGQRLAMAMAKNSSATNRNRFYSFRFDHHSPFMAFIGCEKWMGVCHAMDLPFTFGLPIRKDIVKLAFTNKDRHISENVVRAWTRFAHTGNPEQMGDVEWPEFFGDNGKTMRQMAIDLKPHVFENEYRDRCENFWINLLLPQ
ncbi:Carboxylesterase 5A [Dermatophagoides farinae]|uniref:Carboxylic ester hydrolase n=1 Tax=Dermatophagoides farinae TaxID=6954 RepID=A0A922I649_DERFA|nr:cholinesterase 1-like [Dermatophagoides farinae]KAH7638858.1 hypothetical protein HUG17_2891 [Dermatophagoides farinae]KAH9522826.1 Carboxylesterase 5A [Dermatophagoides farinae]